MMMMMMILSFAQPGNEMAEVVSRCLLHRPLCMGARMSNLSKVAMQWLQTDSNLRQSGYKGLLQEVMLIFK